MQFIVRNKSIFKYYQLSKLRKLRVIVSIQICQQIIIIKLFNKQTKQKKTKARIKKMNNKMKSQLIIMKIKMKILIRQMKFISKSLNGKEMTIKKDHSKKEVIMIIKMILIRAGVLIIQEATEVVTMHL